MTNPEVDSGRALNAERPFPGPNAYAEQKPGEPRYFWGRDAETDELERLVRSQVLTVLFGTSGAGKTSLLAAGLFPRLRAEGYLPVRVRFKFDARPEPSAPLDLSAQIMSAVRAAAEEHGMEVEQGEHRSSLWEFFQRVEIWSASARLMTPVLVLDQFEELFTIGSESAANGATASHLFEGLGTLSENWIPGALAAPKVRNARGERDRSADTSAIATGGRADAAVVHRFAGRAPLVKIIISLREEFLPDLEALRTDVPSVMRNRMRLLRLRGDVAKMALRQIAPRLVNDEVAELIVHVVTRSQNDRVTGSPALGGRHRRALEDILVEPALLNLFCYQLNERRLRSADVGGQRHADAIDVALVSASSDHILEDFYSESLRGLSTRARDFVEQHLLSSRGYRQPVPRQEFLISGEITAEELETLERRRLIRTDRRDDAMYVELVHDVLAHTIREARLRRLSLERERKRARRRTVMISVLTLAGVIFAGFALVKLQGNEALSTLDSRVVEKKTELRQTEAAITEALSDVTQAVHDAERARSERDRANRERDQSRREAETAKLELTAAIADKNQAQDEARRNAAKAAAASAQAADAARDLETQRLALARTSRELDERRAELARAQEALERLEKRQGIPRQLELQ